MLRVTPAVYDDMIAHAQAEYPKEACGILAGEQGRASRLFRMTNVDHSPVSYTMDPKEQLAVETTLRREQLRMVAIYHSHTATEAYPSPTDVRLAVYPEVSYVLISLTDRAQPVVNSYHIAERAIAPEELTVA